MRRWLIALAVTAGLTISGAAAAELTGGDADALKDEIQTISMANDCQWQGENADPATAVLAGKSRLTARGKRLIDAIRGQYASVPVGAEFTAPTTTVGVKSGR